MAMGDVAIPDYDGLVVERSSIQALWPKYEWKYDWRIVWLKIKSKLSKADPPMSEPPKETAIPTEQPTVAPETTATEPTLAATTPETTTAISIQVTSSAPENWENLFAIGDDGRSVWLRFLPDTKHYRADTLVLIVYGQKVLLDVPRIRIGAAHAAVDKTVQNAPNQPKTNNGFLATIMVMQQLQAAANLDWVDECVPRYLERVGLSQGGLYQLTEAGEHHAIGMAYDLIRRA